MKRDRAKDIAIDFGVGFVVVAGIVGLIAGIVGLITLAPQWLLVGAVTSVLIWCVGALVRLAWETWRD